MSVFSTSLLRSIRQSLGRFLAIAAIVALGCGFYGGLRMTGPDMRIAADRFYDGTHLYDIRLLSTLGYSNSQIGEVEAVDGISAVMPSKSTDVMGEINGEQYAMRISTLPLTPLNASTCEDGCNVESPDPNYLNRLVLETGRWPQKEGECVISADRVAGVPFKLGDTLEVLYGSQKLDDVLEHMSYTIVGTAHSSAFVSAVTMGATSLGSGSIQQFAYVSENSFTEDCPYTELFIEVDGARELFSGSDEYKSHIATVTSKLEAIAPSLAKSRLEDIKQDAQKELDEENAQFEEEKADALSKLDEAKEELDSAEEELSSGQQDYYSGVNEYSEGVQELENQMYYAQTQLDDAYNTLASKQSQLDSAQAQLDANREQVNQWPTQREELVSQLSAAQLGLQTAQEGLSAIEALEQQAALLPEGSPQREQIEAQLALREQEKQEALAAVASLPNAIRQLETGIAEGDALVAQFAANEAEVQSGYEQLAQGWTQYYQQAEEARIQFSDAQAQLDEAKQTLDDSKEEIEQGRQDFESGKTEYETERKKALDEIADAASLIAEAQHDIDTLEEPDIYVLDRTKNYGVSSQVSDSERIDNIGAVFPLIFFLVAALVALTTMTRMVEEERNLIGTFKALGYSKGRIASRYLIYAGIASIAGAAIGLALLSQILPFIIAKAYGIIYNIPDQPLPLAFNWPLGLISGGLGVAITLAATLAAVLATLRETPASLMLPRAPRAGKRIMLERIGPLWKRLSFSWKVTFRNLFRYKKRLFMTVIGIAGCTALLLTGWGLHDAIWDIIDKQFGPIVNYNVIAKMETDSSDAEVTEVEKYMISEGETEDITRVHSLNMQISSPSHDTLGVEVVVPQHPQSFTRLLTLKDRLTQTKLPFDNNAVILTEKLARTLQVDVGDTFTIFEQDEIGNATGSGFEMRVTGIMENYIGNWAYFGPDAFADATGIENTFTTLYGRCTEDLEKRAVFTEGMHAFDKTQTVTFNDETIDSYRKMLSSVDMIVVVLVVSAAALAFIVLYNLTNINITERRREIASLKVLGFTKREVLAYIFREIMLLALLGAFIGLFLGILLEAFVVTTAEVDYVMFGRDIHIPSFILSFAMTIIFSMFVMIFMRHKLHEVDMVESLKSVE